MRTITAKFDSICPQCKVAIKTGDPVHQSKHDKVWRCETCTKMFEELGPVGHAPYLSIADKEADFARRHAIIEKYGRTQTFTTQSKLEGK